MRHSDPAALTTTERLDELGHLLARGVQRHLAAQRKANFEPRNPKVHLDAVTDAEAPCRSRVPSPKSRIA